jgi:hypothetical protein
VQRFSFCIAQEKRRGNGIIFFKIILLLMTDVRAWGDFYEEL